jgi:hypothetical protein
MFIHLCIFIHFYFYVIIYYINWFIRVFTHAFIYLSESQSWASVILFPTTSRPTRGLTLLYNRTSDGSTKYTTHLRRVPRLRLHEALRPCCLMSSIMALVHKKYLSSLFISYSLLFIHLSKVLKLFIYLSI